MNPIEKLGLLSRENYILDVNEENLLFYNLSLCHKIALNHNLALEDPLTDDKKSSLLKKCTRVFILCPDSCKGDEVVSFFVENFAHPILSLFNSENDLYVDVIDLNLPFAIVVCKLESLNSAFLRHSELISENIASYLIIYSFHQTSFEQSSEFCSLFNHTFICHFTCIVAFVRNTAERQVVTSSDLKFAENSAEEQFITSSELKTFVESSSQNLCAIFYFANFVKNFSFESLLKVENNLNIISPDRANSDEPRSDTSLKLFHDYLIRMKSLCGFLDFGLGNGRSDTRFSVCNFDYTPCRLLQCLTECLDKIGVFGCLVLSKKFKFDVDKIVNIASDSADVDLTNEKPDYFYNVVMSTSQQIASTSELFSLECFNQNRKHSENPTDVNQGSEDCFEIWNPFILKVFETAQKLVIDQNQRAIILCHDRFICVALATSLRLLAKNRTNQNGDKILVGHSVDSYSLDKIVQMVERQKQSDLWFELQKGRFNVICSTYEVIATISRRNLNHASIVCYDLPNTVQQLTSLFRSNTDVAFISKNPERCRLLLSDLIAKVKIIHAHLFSKYITFTHQDLNGKVGDGVEMNLTARQLDGLLEKDKSFQILKRHQDKMPRDVYFKPLIVFKIDLSSNNVKLLFSLWRTDVKQLVQSSTSFSDSDQLGGTCLKLCKEALEVVREKGELDSESGEIVKRKILIRQILQDLNEEEDEDILQSIEADTLSDTLLKGYQGSKKRRRVYPKHFPTCLNNSIPADSKQCFFYTISLSTYQPINKPVNSSGDSLASELCFDTDQCYGILTSAPLPSNLPTFTIHTREGEEKVQIGLCLRVLLSDDEIDSVAIFHQYVFNDVLRIEKDVLVFDPNESPLQYYVAIATKDEDGIFIDFQLMSDVITESLIPFKQQHPFKFSPHNFRNSVVSPIYRKCERPHRMYVVKIRTDLNPMSDFPQSNLYETYSDYYRIKYGADITNLRQPLLEVEYTNLRLNLLTSRARVVKGGAGGKNSTSISEMKEVPPVENDADKQFFVPELCYVWPIAAPLWKKTICLPSILYRLEQILVSHDLRVRINIEAFGAEEDDIAMCLMSSDDKGDVDDEKNGDGCGKKNFLLNSSFEKNCFERQRHFFDLNAVQKSVPPSAVSPCHILQCLTMTTCVDVVNLERIETIGDSFLKYVSSVALALNHPTASSGELSIRRCRFVSNENLFKIGVQKNIPGFVFHQLFDPVNNWLPPCYAYQKCDDTSTSFSQATRLNFPSEWKTVETGVWTNEKVGSNNSDSCTFIDPEVTNQATYRVWSQNTQTQQTGVEWDRLPSTATSTSPVNGLSDTWGYRNGSNGSNGLNGTAPLRSNNGSPNPLSVFTLSEDLLSGLDQVEIDREIEETFLDPDGVLPDLDSDLVSVWNQRSPEKGPNSTNRHFNRQFNSSNVDKMSLPSPYVENCISDKSVADVIEALIGCYLVESGPENASKLMKWLKIPVIEDGMVFEKYSNDYCQLNETERAVYNSRNFKNIESLLNYDFKTKRILIEAFTHPSASDVCPDLRNYQQLEFIGDAVLDFLITKQIYYHQNYLSSGALTDLRAALVNNIIFASLTVQHKLHKYIVHQSPALTQHIQQFVSFKKQQQQNTLIGEGDSVGIDMTSEGVHLNLSDDLRWDCSPNEDLEVPKPLGDVFESLVAAIYIDCHFDLSEVWRVIKPLIWPTIEKYSKNIPVSPMRELMELKPGRVAFERIEDTVDHKIQVRVTVTALSSYIGVGMTLRGAKSAAAQQALKDIKCKLTTSAADPAIGSKEPSKLTNVSNLETAS